MGVVVGERLSVGAEVGIELGECVVVGEADG